MTSEQYSVPEPLKPYMAECKAEPGSDEWFRAAFMAAGKYATKNIETLAFLYEAKHHIDCDDDEGKLAAVVEPMVKEASMASLWERVDLLPRF